MYLKTNHIPTFQYQIAIEGNNVELRYRWKDAEDTMPIKAGFGLQNYQTITPTKDWQKMSFPKVEGKEFKIATELFYIKTEKI
jgi:hypothetical protein